MPILSAAFFALSLLAASVVPAMQWSVAVVGDAGDARVIAVREAVAHWNRELEGLGVSMRLGPVTRLDAPRIDEGTLQEISAGALAHNWFRVEPDLHAYHADVVILLSDSELISVGLAPHRGRPGLIVLREAHDAPLSLPNVARNVVAHELGHVLGLSHNEDSSLLMCGRPASCRPALFRSDDVHFFPLSDEDKAKLRERFAP